MVRSVQKHLLIAIVAFLAYYSNFVKFFLLSLVLDRSGGGELGRDTDV